MLEEQRKPDYILKVQSKLDRDKKARVGAGWTSKDGKYINIQIDFGCVLLSDNTLTINLFPNDK